MNTHGKESKIENQRVLLVEDDPMVQLVTIQALERCGFTVVLAKDGLEAVKKVLATKSRTFFDYILMDLDMPILDGFETSIELKRYGFKNPIISFSSKTDLKRLEKKSIIDHSLQKPIVPDEFMSIVRRREAAKKEEAAH